MGGKFASGEHKGANDFLSAKQPRGRRNSISQSNNIHLAKTADVVAPARTFTSADMEALREGNRGAISIKRLISMLHKSQEESWDPGRGGGRRQIRTGRNFSVPDSGNPGKTFVVRIHTNDNTIKDPKLHAYSGAVVRIQRTVDGKYLMGGRSRVGLSGERAWSGRNATDEDINAAHIPTKK